MEQVCAARDYAHKLSLVHRDIKPANTFLETSRHIRILDFGMVKTSSFFMAPDQIRGEVCTAAADIFSCGIVFYQLSSSRHPFSKPGVGLPQIVGAILFDAPPHPTQPDCGVRTGRARIHSQEVLRQHRQLSHDRRTPGGRYGDCEPHDPRDPVQRPEMLPRHGAHVQSGGLRGRSALFNVQLFSGGPGIWLDDPPWGTP